VFFSKRVNLRFTRSVWKLSRAFFIADSRRRAWGMFALLIALLFLVNGVNVLLSYIGRDFMSSLEARNPAEFYKNLWFYLIGFACATLLAVFYRFTEERLALIWREWMTQHLLKKYFFNRAYYRLRNRKEIDNPDQRVAEDVRSFTATTLSLLLIVLNSIITIVAFMGVLYSISTALVVVLFIYGVVGTVATVYIGRRLVRLHFRQYRREADFRYGLIRVRDHAESVAFYRGEPRERIDLSRRFRSVFRNFSRLIIWNRNLGVFTTGYNYLALIIPTIIVAPLYLAGTIKIGVVTQAAGAFAQVLAAFSIVITQFERISAYAAGVGRLESLWNALNADAFSEEDDDPQIAFEEGDSLVLKGLTVSPPGQSRILVEQLDLALKKGKSLLIMGASGRGKSSILRAIAGLWQSGGGTVFRPQLREMMFLPQRPYMPVGSLRAQLMYPAREKHEKTKELLKTLREVNLESVLERTRGSVDIVLDWANVLSLGEQQRIAFARLFYQKPKLAFLDEATSALDEENEEMLYKKLRESKISYISVGHRSTLRPFHDFVLTLEDEGKWQLEKT